MNTKNKIIIVLAGILILATAFLSISNTKNMNSFDKGDKYKKMWQKVDSLEQKGLPKSALEVVEEIYKLAKNDKNHDQIIKSFIFRLKYKNAIEENAFEGLIKELENEAKTAIFPNNAIMHSMLAEMYWMYYNANRWKFMQRTNTANFKNDDMQTWTLDNLINVVIGYYNKSIEAKEELQKTPVNVYNEIIQWGTQPKTIRPTLYDFLAHRAINFYSITELSLSRPADYFQLKEDFYFADAKTFANTIIKTKDTLSLHFHGIRVLQDLLKFRYADQNSEAYIDADLLRFTFVKNHSVHPNKDSLYLHALKSLEEKYNTLPYSSEISYLIASYYFEQSKKYEYFNKDTETYKNYKNIAFDICEKTLKSFPNASGALKCKSLQTSILFKTLSFKTENIVIPNQKFPVKITYNNIEKLFVRVASIKASKVKDLQSQYYGTNLLNKLKKESKIIYTENYSVPVDNDFNEHSLELIIKELPIGFYMIMVSNNADFTYDRNLVSYDFITSTNFSYIQQHEEDGSINIYTLNRKTGKPIVGAEAQTWYEQYNYETQKNKRYNAEKYTTDENGFFKIKPYNRNESHSLFIDFKKDSDFYTTDNSIYAYHSYQNKYKTTQVTFFTDRAIYRPGQTIYFKGIITNSDGKQSEIYPNCMVNVILNDVNYQKVAELNLRANEYGTFSGTFNIPTGLLNGRMQISTSYGSKEIRVEEYKRPTFEVEMLPMAGNYLLNDTVVVKGKAKMYAGSNLTDAMVKFRVQRTPVWRGWWYYRFTATQIEIANGTITTNENGEFTIKFKAIPDLSLKKNDFLVFRYNISIDVTDLNGETQSTNKSMTVGYRALQVSLPIPQEINKNDFSEVEIVSQNLNNENIHSKGTIKINRLNDNATFYRSRKWEMPDKYLISKENWNSQLKNYEYENENDFMKLSLKEEVVSISFDTEKDKKFKLNNIKNWPCGRYVAEIKSVDAFNNPVNSKTYFTIFDLNETKPAYKTDANLTVVKNYGEPGEKAQFIFGTSDTDVLLIYEIEHQGKSVKKEYYKLSDEQKTFEIPIEEKHRGNFSVHFSFVKENKVYIYSELVSVPYSNKDLDIKFETFRDKIQPGEKEEWRIRIKGPKSDKVAAEMVATLYDASLDAFVKNNWFFYPFGSYSISLGYGAYDFNISNSSTLTENLNIYYYPPSYYYDNLNWFGFSYYKYGYYYGYDGGGVNKMAESKRAVMPSAVKKSKKKNGDAEEKTEVMFEQSKDEDKTTNTTPPPPPPPMTKNDDAPKQDGELGEVKVRTNFNETAFFYPHLMTNENGEIIVKFTVPESLTKWKMMGFAHTQDLKFGFIQNSLVTQKTLMLMPNAPRFFREFDEIEFPVKINNIADKDLTGDIQIEFFDPITMKPVEGIMQKDEKAKKTFEVKAGRNSLITWKLKIPDGYSVISYKVVAKAGEFSDGEQKPIPVMTNRMLVTESMPLPIRSKETKVFKLDKLLNSGSSTTIKHHRVTLEFTSNPAWYAIQALPYLMEYPYECSEQTFSRFYANSIASHIANSSPKIKAVFDSWKGNKESLLSNLEKNQELKSVLLQETPWVLNSQSETERKHRVGLLFDLNKMAEELGRAIKKLMQEQTSNGGWPWFTGMPESRYITQHIVCGMGHLDRLGVKKIREDNQVWNMVVKAVGFVDNAIVEEYNWLKRYYDKKQMEENHLSGYAIQYMYGRSFFKDIALPSKTKEAFDYYKKQMEKYWLSQGQYSQGMIALILNRYESKTIANDVVKSLKEHSTSHEELGMYWKNNIAGYYWYQAPIETQALMIEVFDEVTNDKKAVDDMKVWLLKQKQTQDWKTTKATTEACYALLLKGTDWLASDELCQITVGSQLIEPKKMDDVKVEAGTGYFKVAWTGGEIKPEMGIVKVVKTNEGVSWGALYWQYFENLDKITSHETPLKLKKQLFKEVITDRGKTMEPITTGKLKVGDKVIVRIELRVDRAMEYVHMKDMRASGFEPVNVLSRYKYQDGLGYYETTKDASTNFFIGWLEKGTYVFEYPLRVTHNGDFSNGITTIQCMYAPEFTSHSEGVRVKVEK